MKQSDGKRREQLSTSYGFVKDEENVGERDDYHPPERAVFDVGKKFHTSLLRSGGAPYCRDPVIAMCYALGRGMPRLRSS